MLTPIGAFEQTLIGTGVERGVTSGIKGERPDVKILQTAVDRDPKLPAIVALEDAMAERSRVQRLWSLRINGQKEYKRSDIAAVHVGVMRPAHTRQTHEEQSKTYDHNAKAFAWHLPAPLLPSQHASMVYPTPATLLRTAYRT